MAEITTTSGSTASNRKKFSTRVDLTPMVDLGFLLITFFVFTTSISSPTSIKLILPDDGIVEGRTKSGETKTLTLLLAEDDNIYYYRGFPGNNMLKTNYNADGVRTVVNDVMNDVAARFGDRKEMTVIIKPTSRSTYKNLVDVLDEMLINGVSRYAVVDLDKVEQRMVE